MAFEGKSTRLRRRLNVSLPLQVYYRVNPEFEWTEETRTGNLSEIGVGFELNSPVEKDRLIRLTLPMHKTLRLYDHRLDQYSIWGVVRYLGLLPSIEPNRIRIATGVAFIGKNPPNNYLDDPTTRYELTPMLLRDGLWGAREIPRNIGRYARQDETRYEVETDVSIETIDMRGQIMEHDPEAKTRNVSGGGAAVVTKLSPEISQFVRVSSESHNVSLIAIVRGRQAGEETSTLNLQFQSGKWVVNET